MYPSACEVVDSYLNIKQIADNLIQEALSISCAVQPLIEEEDAEEIEGMLNVVSILNLVTHEDKAEEQKKDPILSIIFHTLQLGEN